MRHFKFFPKPSDFNSLEDVSSSGNSKNVALSFASILNLHYISSCEMSCSVTSYVTQNKKVCKLSRLRSKDFKSSFP